MIDDMGYGDLSSYGRKEYVTPNLDKLASQGIKLIMLIQQVHSAHRHVQHL